MKPVFISYRRNWSSEVQSLVDAGMFRGLPVFLDVSSQARIAGSGQNDRLRAIIEDECSGMLLYVTRDMVDSPTIWNLEVPTALARLDKSGEFPIVPIFRDIRPSAVRTDLRPHGQRIASLGGVVATPSGDPTSEANQEHLFARFGEAANAMLDLQLGIGHSLLSSNTIRVGIMTREVGIGEGDADLVLDWRAGYPSDVPAVQVCSQIHDAALDLSAAVAKAGYRKIKIVGQAHISAAILLGAVFGKPAGFTLEVTQYDDEWSSDGPTSESPVDILASQLDPATSDIFLAVAISRPEVVGSAEAAMGKLGIAYGGRVVAMPSTGPNREALTSAEDARSAVASITGALMDARAKWGAGPVHLFVSAPFAFSVLLGHHLNALGPILVYEYSKGMDTYHQAFEIH